MSMINTPDLPVYVTSIGPGTSLTDPLYVTSVNESGSIVDDMYILGGASNLKVNVLQASASKTGGSNTLLVQVLDLSGSILGGSQATNPIYVTTVNESGSLVDDVYLLGRASGLGVDVLPASSSKTIATNVLMVQVIDPSGSVQKGFDTYNPLYVTTVNESGSLVDDTYLLGGTSALKAEVLQASASKTGGHYTLLTQLIDDSGSIIKGYAKGTVANATDYGIAPLYVVASSSVGMTQTHGQYGSPRVDNSGSTWIINESLGYVSASAPPKVTVIGGFANMGVPNPVTQSNAVNFWTDELGRIVLKGYSNALNALNTYEISPAINQNIILVNLSGSTTNTSGSAVDVSLYTRKTVYISASCATGSATITIEHSPDSTDWYRLDQKSYISSSAKDSFAYDSYMPYIRTQATNVITSVVYTFIAAKSA